MRVLIADDNVALQEILLEAVFDAGHSAEAASSIDGAMFSIESFRHMVNHDSIGECA